MDLLTGIDFFPVVFFLFAGVFMDIAPKESDKKSKKTYEKQIKHCRPAVNKKILGAS
jgi:hypothetical protein